MPLDSLKKAVPSSWQRRFFGLRLKIWLLLLLLLIIGAVLIINIWESPGLSAQRITQLKASEVREYQGEKLSSITDVQNVSYGQTQNIDINKYSLEITGLVEKPEKYTYAQVLDRPKYSKVVDIQCVEGWSAKILWEGILLQDLLETAGVKPTAKVAIFTAADGFTTSLLLDYIKDNNIILAYKMNNVVIPPEKGFPFQLVAEQKWGYKWVKWLTKIELSDDVNYKGTYEKAGYSIKGDINGD